MFLLSSVFLVFSEFSILSKFVHTIKMSNGFYSDHNRRSVGPDLGPNYLQKFPLVKKEYSWSRRPDFRLILSPYTFSVFASSEGSYKLRRSAGLPESSSLLAY